MEDKLTVHVRHMERTLRVSAIGLFLAASVWLLRDILLLTFSAVVIACVLRGASNAIQRVLRSGPYTSLVCVIGLTCLVVGALLWWRGSAIFNQADEISQQLRTQLERIWSELADSWWGSVFAQPLQIAGTSLRAGLTGYVPGVIGSVLGIGGTLVVVGATAIFLAASPQLYLEGALRLLPTTWRPRGREVAGELGSTLRLWFLGQFIDMVIVGLLLGLGLFLIGSPLALSLALLAGLLNFVPYIGALAGAVPAILVALAQSPALAAWVSLLFLSIQLLEGNVIAPWIQKRTISLPPALTILPRGNQGDSAHADCRAIRYFRKRFWDPVRVDRANRRHSFDRCSARRCPHDLCRGSLGARAQAGCLVEQTSKPGGEQRSRYGLVHSQIRRRCSARHSVPSSRPQKPTLRAEVETAF